MLFPDNFNIWLHKEPTDMRKSINGLSLLVANFYKHNLQSGDIFIFYNRNKDKIKAIYWHYNGFCLLQKNLDRNGFKIPKELTDVISLSKNQLLRLFDGLHFFNKKADNPDIFY
ncbi:IS66 family insertion sequence element accessory protein TnpB [Candidatus Dojkabacteria bacterium]|uniref:IS66 family insertion sequence element accessory protein TnpB n=1 Tax=Candidatus Dojkabacteria bacterium TaxID=2099670 RepID=A0A955I8I4_9BACT|nr:IS66 family insertion sequence element accessory protein TnpB [Candidatus Dojkabacteria bacterium]